MRSLPPRCEEPVRLGGAKCHGPFRRRPSDPAPQIKHRAGSTTLCLSHSLGFPTDDTQAPSQGSSWYAGPAFTKSSRV